MLNNQIVAIDAGYESYDQEHEYFHQAGYKFKVFQGGHHDRTAKIKYACDAVGVLVRWTKIDDDFFKALPNVKAIVRYGVGYDNINLDAATKHNVRVSNVQGYANHAVSDHALALIYACTRALPLGQQKLYSAFTKPPRRPIFEFHDKTLGIIGLGRIGSTLCKKTVHLFDKILATDPYIPNERFQQLGAQRTDLDSLLEQSHVISIHCNLTNETRHLISKTAFQKMHKTPVVINTARGPVVNETELLQALESNNIHSAGLDVYQDEPPLEKSQNLLNHPHVIATGHYAWYSEKAGTELQKRATVNMVQLLQGNIPDDCLNP